MKTSMRHHLKPSGTIRTVLAVLALATALGGMAMGTAHADEWRHERGHYRDHGRRYNERWYGNGGYVYQQPGYYYAPPPPVVYEAPAPSPGINFVFPLHIR